MVQQLCGVERSARCEGGGGRRQLVDNIRSNLGCVNFEEFTAYLLTFFFKHDWILL